MKAQILVFNFEYFVVVLFSHLCLLPVQILGLEVLLGSEDLWPVLLGLTVVPTVLQMSFLPFCPESPRFLYIVRCQEHQAKRGEVLGYIFKDLALSLKDVLSLSSPFILLYIVMKNDCQVY